MLVRIDRYLQLVFDYLNEFSTDSVNFILLRLLAMCAGEREQCCELLLHSCDEGRVFQRHFAGTRKPKQMNVKRLSNQNPDNLTIHFIEILVLFLFIVLW